MAERKAQAVSAEQMEEQQMYMTQVRNLPERPRTFHVVTYGCQMNAHDSEYLAGMLKEMGMEEAAERDDADFVIFNTCCVRDNAERRALGNVNWLRLNRKKNPRLKIAVCGCMVQQPGMAERILKQYRFIDLAFGTANLYRMPEMIYKTLTEDRAVVEVDNQDVIPENMPVQRLRSDAAYVTIMYGCDNFCSYCVVPYVRGRERSRDMDAILREAEELQHSGVKEIMLLGQNVNSYGKGLADDVTFAKLLHRLDAMGIERIRFMTSHPKDLSDELIEAMDSCKHVLPQFHLPVQSGNDEILKQMNRHYDRAHYLERLHKLRETVPGIGVTTDIIVAFPGETEEQFQDTISLVEQVEYDSAFTFVYSPRSGTRAAKMDCQIPPEVASERIQRLIAVQEAHQKHAMERFLNMREEVLVESLSRRSETAVSGKGLHGLSITLEGTADDVGQIVPVTITEIKNNTLIGKRLTDV
jgi:tRNA-2-methylthio-N6-dimethylallyladenosine synthase